MKKKLQVLSAFRILHACYDGEGNANYNEQIKRIEAKMGNSGNRERLMMEVEKKWLFKGHCNNSRTNRAGGIRQKNEENKKEQEKSVIEQLKSGYGACALAVRCRNEMKNHLRQIGDFAGMATATIMKLLLDDTRNSCCTKRRRTFKMSLEWKRRAFLMRKTREKSSAVLFFLSSLQ